MPYVGKKPADIIATSVDTDTGAFSGNVTAGGTLGVTGAVTANAGVVVDNITIDGTEIDLSSGDLTLDVAGDISLDADGGDVLFKDGGTQFGALTNSSTDFVIQATTQDKDIIFKGNDGGATTTVLTLDMSEAGQAIFNQRGRFNGATQEGILTVASNTTSNLGSTNAQITLQNTNQTNNSKGLVTFKTASDAGNGYHGVAFGGISTNSSDSSRQTAFSVYVADADNVDLSNDERLRIHPNGVASFNNGIALGVGTANTASNVLDDYEEGTWTPATNSSSYNTGSSTGRYTKIGRIVIVHFAINFSGVNSSSNSIVNVTNLPFTSTSDIAFSGSAREQSNTGAIYTTRLGPGATIITMNSMDNITNGSQRTIRTSENYSGTMTYMV